MPISSLYSLSLYFTKVQTTTKTAAKDYDLQQGFCLVSILMKIKIKFSFLFFVVPIEHSSSSKSIDDELFSIGLHFVCVSLKTVRKLINKRIVFTIILNG